MKKIFTSFLFIILCYCNAGATIFTVNTTSDVSSGSGTTGSLRWCILQANTTTAKDTINFSITGTGPFIFSVASNYAVINNPLYINGFSQPGSVQGQLGTGTRVMQIVLDGPGSNTVYGLQSTASNCEFSGLVIQDFYVGISLSGGTGNWIWGCYIGTNSTGLSVSSTTTCFDDGIRLSNSSSNNFIGTNGDGSNDANEGNCIGGNGDGGAQFLGECITLNEGGTISTSCTGNLIAGNYLGINESGTAALYYNPTAGAQRGTGVQINYSTANIIGTNADGISDVLERNIISGNSDAGVVLLGASSNKIKGNYIGTDKTGLLGVPNYGNGGTAVTTNQVVLKTSSTNNFIGTDGDGVRDNIEGNIIGSSTISATSTASYSDGIDITTTSTGNRVSGNYIGIGANGTTTLNILTTGIVVNDYAINVNANNNIIGTNGDGISDALESNYIGNSGSGIVLDNVTGCVAAGNYIGLGSNKTTAEGLGYAGIYIIQSGPSRIGSSALNINEMNYICNSSQYGIWIDDLTLKVNDYLNIRYNTIGLRPDNTPAPNAKHGIYLVGESDADTIQYNIITRNGTASATGIYAGIRIGETYASGDSRHGYIYKNQIFKNNGAGIEIANSLSVDNQITQNNIYNNGNASDATGKLKLGIDLNIDNVTLNDTKDPDSGPNGLSNFPVITSAIASGGSCVSSSVSGTFNGLASTQYFVEVFSSDVCNGDTAGVDYYSNVSFKYGEGKTYEGTSTVFTTDVNGNANWTTSIALTSLTGQYLTAVAIQNTASLHNTSEFSMCYDIKTDFGDAPDSYHTLSASCGPVHANTNTNLKIGATVTVEDDGQPSVLANLDVDDGLGTLPALSVKSASYTLSAIPVTNTTGSAATLYAWIDFNLNGLFEATEYTSVSVPSGSTTATLTWNLSTFTCASTIKSGISYLRMRLTTDVLTDNGGTPTVDERSYGGAGNGEVEDYRIYISGVDYGDLSISYPVATAYSLQDTAIAKVWAGVTKPSIECTQHYSPDAYGDGPEEDGLVTSFGGASSTNTWVIKLNANQANKTVYYGFWIDWDANSNFTSALDRFYSGSAVVNGVTNVPISVTVPVGYSTSANFRLIVSDAPLTSSMYNATIVNGEVEDFSLLLILHGPGNVLMGSSQAFKNILKWKNSSGLNVSSYTLERSNDIIQWNTLGEVSIATSDNSATQYVFSDLHPEKENNYYRLKINFDDSSFLYSNVVLLSSNNNSQPVIIFPDPAINTLNIRNTNGEYTHLKIYDLTGRLEISQDMNSIDNTIDISTISAGTHLIKFSANNGLQKVQKFIKLKK